MTKKIWVVGIVLMLLLTMPAMANERKGSENVVGSSAKVVTGGGAGNEAVDRGVQIGAVRYGPITCPAWCSYSFYIPWGGSFTGAGAPVTVASLELPWVYPSYANQQFSLSFEKGWVGNSYVYAHVTSEHGYNLTGSNINVIGIKLN